MIAARASLNMLYAKERHLWQTMAAEAAASAVMSNGVGLHKAAIIPAVADGVLDSAEASSLTVLSGESDGGSRGGEICRDIEETAVAKDKASADDDRERARLSVGPETEETADTTAEPGAKVPNTPDVGDTEDVSSVAIVDEEDGEPASVSEAEITGDAISQQGHAISSTHSELAKKDEVNFSPVTIVDEPGGKSVGVSAALGSLGGEAQEMKFSHVQILQEPGGESCGVSGALSADVDGVASGKALTAEPLPGRSGVRRIVQEPGGNSSAVASILGHSLSSEADKAVRISGLPPTEESGERGDENEAFPRSILQESGGIRVGASPPVEEEAAAGNDDSGGRTRRKDPPHYGSSSDFMATEGVEGRGVEPITCDENELVEPSNGVSRLQKLKKKEKCAGGRATDGEALIPLEMTLHRCVRDPVLAQCSAVDSAALAFLVQDAGVAEHLASLRTFLLGLTSDFLHDFTMRLLDGLYDGG